MHFLGGAFQRGCLLWGTGAASGQENQSGPEDRRQAPTDQQRELKQRICQGNEALGSFVDAVVATAKLVGQLEAELYEERRASGELAGACMRLFKEAEARCEKLELELQTLHVQVSKLRMWQCVLDPFSARCCPPFCCRWPWLA